MKKYMEQYPNRIFLAGVFVLLVHGAKLNSNIVGIDTEALICQQGAFYGGWLGIGRQGLVLLKWLSGCMDFNPYFAGLMTLVFLVLAVAAFLGLWDKASGGGNAWGWMACALLWAAHPVLTEQFYFSLQSMEVCLGMLLMAGALYLILQAQGKMWMYAAGTFLLMILFSLYQIFVVMFIFGTVSVLVLQTLHSPHTEKSITSQLRRIVPWLAVFLVTFISNSLVTSIFFNKTQYLDEQVLWGRLDVKENLYRILTHVVKVLTGYHFLYSSWVYGALCLVGLALALALWKRYGWVLVFYYAALMTTPFLMALVCGNVPVARSQLVLPLMTGFVAYLDIQMLGRLGQGIAGTTRAVKTVAGSAGTVETGNMGQGSARAAGWILGALCLAGVWMEVQVTESLYYTDACRYAQDEALGRELISRLEPLAGTDEIPVVILGSRTFAGNNSCVQGETIGKSIFDYDTDVEPQFYWSTGRIIGFLHTLGYDCEPLPANRIPYACEFAEEMPSWPDGGSVVHAGDMIIVKLSEYQDIIN